MKRFFRKSFINKIRFKYKVSILNENTLEETFNIRLSRLNVFLVTCSFIAICFLINSLLIFKTPLKQFLPGYESSSVRNEIIQNTIQMDSLIHTVKKQEEYIAILRNIMSGDIKIEKQVSLDSLVLKERAKVYEGKLKNEEEFCKEFVEEEQYNLSQVDNSNNAAKTPNNEIFFKPAKGLITDKFNVNRSHYGVNINTVPNENVKSVLEGTVIFTGFTVDEGYVIIIEHNNEFTSVYKNNSELLKSVGQHVIAGESIAIAGNSIYKGFEKSLHFELWLKGKPVNPEDYIIF